MDVTNKPVSQEVDIDELQEQFKAFLHGKRGKVTNERLALLRTLYEHDGHFSVDEIHDLMRAQSISISRATIYRTLDLLVQCKLIRKLSLEGQENRYESSLTSGHHDHIICVDCHKIIEFFNPELEKIQDDILAHHNLKMVRHVHQLYGRCMRVDCPEKKSDQQGLL